jgi:hypothetical protein
LPAEGSPEDLAKFRAWFEAFKARAVDVRKPASSTS